MFYIIFSILFLKPSIKKEDIPGNIGRFITGFIFSFVFFYLFNKDRSISYILSILWIPAIFQSASYEIISEKNKIKTKAYINWSLALVIIISIGYNFFPYISFGSKNLAKMVPVQNSTELVSKIDSEHIIVISPETAYYEMQKMIGTLDNPSKYKIGQLGVTMTNGEASYVAPIEVDGFFRALSTKEIPGVIYVSAEKAEQARVINSPTGISDSFVFSNDLLRNLRKYKKDKVLFEANAELDDDGNAYYIGSYGHYKYGRKVPEIDGVLIYSFKDGQVKDYSIDKVPDWVDEIYPSDVSEKYNKYFGTLMTGLANKLFSKNGVHIPTRWSSDTNVEGLSVNSNEVIGVIDGQGDLKWFTDHTNTSDSSTTMTGYTLMDMKTGKLIYYKTPGYINGKGAMNAVDKTLGADKANWTPVQPLFYNIFGTEAWVVPVVNKTDGALIKIAIVAAKNSYVVLEDSKEAAIESFKNAIAYGEIADSSDKNANSTKAEEKIITGIVSRINGVSENGNTIFYVKLENVDTLFMVNKSAGSDIVITKEKDEVELSYLDIVDNDIVSTTSFKNKTIK
ncbi:MAG: hypothetical protein ACERKV_09385 [Clostridiaceae bacterium]